MKLINFILNVVVSPLLVIGGIYYFYTKDIREAIFLALLLTTVSTVFQFFIKLIKIFFSTLTFNFAGAIKNLTQILTSIGVVILYWLAYYFYYGSNFSTQLF
ncbi:hypothetical protein KC675_02700 [Candidatus Dojkabacteria bacterium]|jgi:hypothetical protein|uniref:Uncharacterized protein n=1 Tax=Candidatus Dojkabacteria bacterium TaxID=2099670 RepID=A0A955I7R7_9BACT|nr:hypothetical protein [Candidatus Dojkabacteria bacterium]